VIRKRVRGELVLCKTWRRLAVVVARIEYGRL
jgi:hypothetical protein